MGSHHHNEPIQLGHRLAIVLMIATPLIGMPGCRPAPSTSSRSASPDSSQLTDQHTDSGIVAPIDWLVKARRQFELGQHEEAAESIDKALIETPDRPEVVFLAARIAQARGNHAESAELAALVPLSNARFGRQAMELRVDQLIQSDQAAAAIALLYDVIGDQPDQAAWRHLLWRELNRLGRRQEASQQADHLCRQGLATLDEVQSLIARNGAFPLRLKSESGYMSQFSPGLGHARWHFTLGNYQQGLDALQDEWAATFTSAAAAALYGRLLAETQDFDRLTEWHRRTDDNVRQFSDYWVAVGAALMSAGEHEAAARALLEAVSRDATDRITYQRLSRTLTALGRKEDAEQMLMLSNQVGTSQQLFIEIHKSPQDHNLWQQQAQWLIRMGRPLEAISWFSYSLPPEATAQQAQLTQHRAELVAMGELEQSQARVALAAIDPGEFQLQPALDQTLATSAADPSATSADSAKARRSAPLAVTPRLIDVAHAVGLDFQWYHDTEINLDLLSLYESLGGGMAVIDFDLDGWPDVYLGQGSATPPDLIATRSNQLMRNQRFAFLDVTQPAGTTDLHYTQGLAAGDVNQDGFPDLFLAAIGTNRLLINNGDGTFSDSTMRLGDTLPRFTTSVGIADVTGDSLPDLIEANYIAWDEALQQPRTKPDGSYEIPGPIVHPCEWDACYQNLGDGRWSRVELRDEFSEPGSGLGLLITDFDARPGNEIFVANDARPNHLWIPDRDGQWTNVANRWGLAHGYEGLATAAMGIAAADFNRDGRIDLHVTNFFNEPSNLYLNAGDNLFSDLAVAWQLDRATRPMVGFGTKAIDFDRNGWPDLIIANGHVFDRLPADQSFRMPPQVILNHGDRFEPVNVDDPSGYFAGSYLGRAMAVGDFDLDHRLDLLIGHLDRPLALLRNETPAKGNWLQFQLVGTASERDAVGATVAVRSGEQTWRGWVTAGDGYYCSDQPLMELAVGEIDRVDRVEVSWPSGQVSIIDSVETNTRYLLVENEAEVLAISP
jgi:tetratricopeptide (TPR) repeat protein